MNIKVNNCLDCPFVVENINYDSTGKEVCMSCNLIKFLHLTELSKNILRFFDYEEWTDLEYLEPLQFCPLKENKIEINYE